MRPGMVKERQDPLCARYAIDAGSAWIEDSACSGHTKGEDPFHGAVSVAGGEPRQFGIHRALGGDHDLPNPGDLLCGSLAACLHATIRMIADRLGIGLKDLEVNVTAEADVRGALRVDPETPVGFQRMTCSVRIRPDGAGEDKLPLLTAAAERSCIVLNTLKHGVDVRTQVEATTTSPA